LIKTAPASVGKKLKWDSGSDLKGTKESWTWLSAQNSQFQEYPQSLSHKIEYYASPHSFGLYYGLCWKKEIPASSKFLSSQPIQNLRRLLEREEYDMTEPEWWFG